MKILFTYKKGISTFIQKDIDILNSFTDVTLNEFGELKKITHFIHFIKQLWLLRNKYDIYYCFFADYHALLPVLIARIRKKKSIIIVAGYDAIGIKDNIMTYGIFTSPWWRQWMVRQVYKKATYILPVAESLKNELIKNGVKIDHRFQTVHFGWNHKEYKIGRKRNFVLSVGYAPNKTTWYRKGFDRIVKIAENLPEVKFIIIGVNFSIETMPSNLSVYASITHQEVLEQMKRAKVYLQLSRAEGMPNTLAEAMLSGCHVVTSDAMGIKDLARNSAIVSSALDHSYQAESAIEHLLLRDSGSWANHNFIKNNFSLEKRIDNLKNIIYADSRTYTN